MIRLARQDELNEINKIRRETFDLHVNALPHIFKITWDEEKELEFLKSVLLDEKTAFYVFEENGKVVGYAQVEKREKLDRGAKQPRRWCHLSDFGVTQNFRGQGIGTKFLKEIKSELKQQGFSKLELNVWEFNKNAMRFYEKNGFETLKRIMETDL